MLDAHRDEWVYGAVQEGKLVPTDMKETEGELREGCQSKKRG